MIGGRTGQLHRGSEPCRVFRTRTGFITGGANKDAFWRPLRLGGTPATLRRRATDLDEYGAEVRAWVDAAAVG